MRRACRGCDTLAQSREDLRHGYLIHREALKRWRLEPGGCSLGHHSCSYCCRVFMNDFSGLEGWHGCVLAISACLAGLPHFCVLSLALTSQLISLFFSPDTFSEYGDVVWFVHFLIFNSLARLDPNLLGALQHS
jgi:hypothetical protein